MTATKERDKLEGAMRSAAATYEHIAELIKRYHAAARKDDGADLVEAVEQEIYETPLSVLVRDGWRAPGGAAQDGAEEFEILLSTGGPAVRIWGKINDGYDRNSLELQCQDWFTPWVEWTGIPYEERKETLSQFVAFFNLDDE